MKNLLIRSVHGEFALSSEKTRSGRVLYRKELAYPGTFRKVNNKTGEVEFELPVDEELIDHWVGTFNRMRERGVRVPVPIGHTSDPSRRRGTIDKLTKEVNDRGQPALFCYVDFHSPRDAERFRHSDVSLFMPPSWTDGQGFRYNMPIQHVAITDYPVIPNLGRFSAVAAGFELSLDEGTGTMTVEELAEQMGIEVGEGQDAGEAILHAWEDGGEEPMPHGNESEGGGIDEIPEEPVGEPAGEVAEDEPASEFTDGDFEDEDLEDLEDPDEQRHRGASSYEPPPAMGFSMLPKTVVNGVAKSRTERLRGLVREGKITPAQATDFANQFCTPEHVGFALSSETVDPQFNDGFEKLCDTLAKGVAASHLGEQTGHQTLESATKSALVRVAEARAARK